MSGASPGPRALLASLLFVGGCARAAEVPQRTGLIDCEAAEAFAAHHRDRDDMIVFAQGADHVIRNFTNCP